MVFIKIEEDRLFLSAQREKGRRGMMAGVDRSLALKEERTMKRKAAALNYAMKSSATATLEAFTVDGNDDFGTQEDSDCAGSSSEISSEPEAGTSTSDCKKIRIRGKVGVVTPEVAAALDRTNVSDRKAAHIISAMVATGHIQQDVSDKKSQNETS